MRQFYRYMLLFLVIAFLAVFLIGPVYTAVSYTHLTLPTILLV